MADLINREREMDSCVIQYTNVGISYVSSPLLPRWVVGAVGAVDAHTHKVNPTAAGTPRQRRQRPTTQIPIKPFTNELQLLEKRISAHEHPWSSFLVQHKFTVWVNFTDPGSS